jgi:outer membrane beta-barrel protein
MSRRLYATLAGAAAAVVLLGGQPNVARAERKNPLEGQPAIRHRVELRYLRFEATPFFGFSFLEDFNLQYHIFDWFGIGGEFGGGGSLQTGVADEILRTLPDTFDPNRPGLPTRDLAQKAMNKTQWMAALQGEFTPITGKLAAFGKLFVNYDFYVYGGVGFINRVNGLGAEFNKDTVQNCKMMNASTGQPGCFGMNTGMAIGPSFGGGVHLFFNQWMAFNAEFRDVIIRDNAAGRDLDGDGLLTTDDAQTGAKYFFTFGFAFYLPTHADVSK